MLVGELRRPRDQVSELRAPERVRRIQALLDARLEDAHCDERRRVESEPRGREGPADMNALPHERMLGVDQRVGDVDLPLAIVLLDPRPVHE